MTEISFNNYKLTVAQETIDDARETHGISLVDFFIQQVKGLPDSPTMKYVRVKINRLMSGDFGKTSTPTGVEVSLEFRDQP